MFVVSQSSLDVVERLERDVDMVLKAAKAFEEEGSRRDAGAKWTEVVEPWWGSRRKAAEVEEDTVVDETIPGKTTYASAIAKKRVADERAAENRRAATGRQVQMPERYR